MTERLLEDTGVALLPGSAFGREPEELTARLAYVDFDGAGALVAAERAGSGEAIDNDDFLRTHCGGVMEAVRRLCDWVRA